jgi:CBS domain-containing protein
MRLEDLVEPYPAADRTADATEAVLQMAGAHRVGIIVLDHHQAPVAVLTGAQILAAVIPRYLRDDPALARVVDQHAADEIVRRLAGRTVGDLLPSPDERGGLPVLTINDTSMEAAVLMADTGSPLVAVTSGGRYVGAVTISRLLRMAAEQVES